jgi:predicted Holliday junction resolvase-like endonuclease
MVIFNLFLIFIVGLILLFVGYYIGRILRDFYWRGEILRERKDAVERSRSILKGQISEQLAPYLPNFSFAPSECKFIGKPIDFIAFKGINVGKIDEIVFVEVKSGKSRLSPIEKEVKLAIKEGRFRFEEYRISEDI